MKYLALAIALALPVLAIDDDQTKKKAPVKKAATVAAKKAPVPSPTPRPQAFTSIPKDAVRMEPNTYRWKDPKGKDWVLRETPFGIAKIDAKEYAPPVAETPTNIAAFEDGDSIRFERPSPFGAPVKWTKKKSELTSEEQAIWKRAQPSASAGQQD
jgi:hypothetical protein